METKKNEIEINGPTYVPKGTEAKTAHSAEGLEYVIVRGDRSGVFAGYLAEKKDREVTLINVRRLWMWSGAASISQLAEKGTSKPSECKFPAAARKIKILDVIEILSASEESRKSLEGVAIWEA